MNERKNAIESSSRNRHKLGLALGGGGARGVSHIGVLKVLVRESIPIDLIVGTSIGALVGGAFAAGQSIEQLEERVDEFLSSPLYRKSDLKVLGHTYGEKPTALVDRIQVFFKKSYLMSQLLSKPGLFDDKEFSEIINFFLPDIQLEQTILPFYAVATDLKTGELVCLNKGSLRKAVLASCSVPGAVNPVEWEEKTLADGGIISLVPATCARELGADFVVAVTVDRDISSEQEFSSALEIYIRAGDIQGFYLANKMLQEADVIIQPEAGDSHWADFAKAREYIEKGELAAEECVDTIKKGLPKPKLWFSLDTILRTLQKRIAAEKHSHERDA